MNVTDASTWTFDTLLIMHVVVLTFLSLMWSFVLAVLTEVLQFMWSALWFLSVMPNKVGMIVTSLALALLTHKALVEGQQHAWKFDKPVVLMFVTILSAYLRALFTIWISYNTQFATCSIRGNITPDDKNSNRGESLLCTVLHFL